jgi:hypothetical protein
MAEGTHLRFRFGEVFPAGDVLAQWIATLALAFNDLACGGTISSGRARPLTATDD